MGSSLPLQALPWMQDTTTNQVQSIYYADGASQYLDFRLSDVARGTACSQFAVQDGSLRCLPSAGGNQMFYSNATGTQMLDVLIVSTGGTSCSPPEVPSYAITYNQLGASIPLTDFPVKTIVRDP